MSVTAEVTNASEVASQYNAVVWLNSVPHTSQSLLVGAGETVTVSFEVQPNIGEYDVRIDRLLDSLVVVPAIDAPTVGDPVVPAIVFRLTLVSLALAIGGVSLLGLVYLRKIARRSSPVG